MLKLKIWSWDKATVGMEVFLVDLDNIQLTISGVVSDVTTKSKLKMIDGKYVKVDHVVSVTIKCTDGKKITVIRSIPKYQIIMKQ